jgi:hypothetical protein
VEEMSKPSKFVPYAKMSKKARRALVKKKRGDWGLCLPVSRCEENRRAYRRHEKHRSRNWEE